MRASEYVRQEKKIAATDTNGIRERWMWGLRILRDPERMAASGLSLRHGVAEKLIAAAAIASIKLSEREIQRRIQCARTYKTETEIRQALADFKTWWDLSQANFPEYQWPEDEPHADHRTEGERLDDHAAAAEEAFGSQPVFDGMELFPKLDPATATLKDLFDDCDKYDEQTASFARHGQKKRDHANRLLDAANNDASTTWAEAERLLPPF